MGNALLRRYLRLAIKEDAEARVPNQLLDINNSETEDDCVDELSTVGCVAGHVAATEDDGN